MKLLEVARILSLLDESIDIHGLAKMHQGNPEFEQAVKDYRSTLQGRKKELLKPFGLDDLDKFKKNPDDFVKMVGYAVDSFKEKKEEKALYKKIYEDDRCLITMPKGPKGAAAAGSFCKVDGEPVCPWCVCIKYPENEKWWEQYNAATLAFIYSKENGTPSDACCILLTGRDALSVIEKGILAYSQVEGLENKGLNGKPVEQRKVLDRLYDKTGLSDTRLMEILTQTLKPMEEELRKLAFFNGLFEASKDGDTERVKECLNAGVDVNARDKIGYTPLHCAARKGRHEVCKLLLDAGADVNAQNKDNKTPLHYAATMCHFDTCKLLIDAGADVEARCEFDYTPLHCAARKGLSEICQLLLDAGADVNATDRNGCTSLYWAAKRGSRETCKVLLDAGADVETPNKEGVTPLAIARSWGRTDVVEPLLKAGARE